MKNLAKFAAALAAALMMLLTVSPVGAVDYDFEIKLEAKRDGNSNKLVLKLDPADGKLFNLENINPGDTRTARITIENNYTRAIDLYLWAEDLMEEPESEDPEDPENPKPSLLKQLVLTVSHRGNLLYEGNPVTVADFPVPGSPGEYIKLGRYSRYQTGELVATLHLPGPTTGNQFQGKTASVNWIFGAEPVKGGGGGGGGGTEETYEPEPPAVPPEEEELEITPEPPGVKPDMPRTGQEAPYLYYLLGGLALLTGTQMIRRPKRR